MGNVMSDSIEQFLKAELPMLVNVDGRSMVDNDEQPSKV